jgi:hypothetical protein
VNLPSYKPQTYDNLKPENTMQATQGAATAEDFARWRNQAKNYTTEQLVSIVRMCRKAALYQRNINPIREGYWDDQACTYADELRKR